MPRGLYLAQRLAGTLALVLVPSVTAICSAQTGDSTQEQVQWHGNVQGHMLLALGKG